MGLSSRRQKQRISVDPRNTGWANDAARFGQSYLAKLGWDPSKGLGTNGDGRTSHIKVSQKLDMLGIGAAQKKDGSSIAWKQNQDFENVLKRLNESRGEQDGEEDGNDDGERVGVEESPIDERKKKRKRPRDGEKAERKRSKSTAKRNKAQDLVRAEECSVKPAVVVHAPLSRLRRQRVRNMLSKSPATISEILGIATTVPPEPSSNGTPLESTTPSDEESVLPVEKLTTSTKSIADYFNDRLASKNISR